MSAAEYLLRRLGLSIVVILGVMVMTFVISRLVPSSPERLYAGPRANSETLAEVRKKLGLDQSIPTQFSRYIRDILQGDLGESYATKRPIIDDLKTFLPATLEITIAAMILAMIVGIPIGVLAGALRGKPFDVVSRTISITGVSIPNFWLALLLQLLFFGTLGWLPLGGRIDMVIDISSPVERVTGFLIIDSIIMKNWIALEDALLHLVLPVLVLAVYPIALAMRITRASMIEALSEDYVMAARAAGVPQHRIMFRMALKNAIIPTLTLLGITFAYTITGAFLIEIVFSWPGVGKYVADAILSADFPVVMAVTLIITVIYVIVNLAVDLFQVAIDPRIRLD